MPLLRRKPVLMVPVPKEVEEGLLPDDSQVYLIKDTGEIFLHYECVSSPSLLFHCGYSCTSTNVRCGVQ